MVRDSGRVSTLRHHYQDDLETFTWSALVAIGIAIKDQDLLQNVRASIHYALAGYCKKKKNIFEEHCQ